MSEIDALLKECRDMTASLLSTLKAMQQEEEQAWQEISAMIADCQSRVQTIKNISFN